AGLGLARRQCRHDGDSRGRRLDSLSAPRHGARRRRRAHAGAVRRHDCGLHGRAGAKSGGQSARAPRRDTEGVPMTASRSLIAAARGRRESTRGGGFTLIEVLIALVVMSVGLLGLASLQTNTLAFNRDAYLRSQATALAYDIIDRMRANRDAAVN